MRKGTIILICSLMLVIFTGFDAHAASNPTVYSDNQKAGQNSELEIPVIIKNNTGLAGFRITVSYDDEMLEAVNVTGGNVISEGLFNNNLGNRKSSFDVLWSNATDTKENGELFKLYFKTTKKFNGETYVRLSYDKRDTFNEKFEDVKLTCSDILITYDSNNSESNITTNPAQDHLVTEIKDEIVSQLDDKETVQIIEDAMKKNGVKDLKKATPKQAVAILSEVINKMKEQGISTDNLKVLLKDLSQDENIDSNTAIVEAMVSLYEAAQNNIESSGKSIDLPQEETGNKPALFALLGILIICGIAGVVIWRRKQARSYNSEEE